MPAFPPGPAFEAAYAKEGQAILDRYFATPPGIAAHAGLAAQTGPYPAALAAVLSPDMTARARQAICGWPGYAPTPLRPLDRLAGALDLGAVLYKDESARFGLGSFKALGGAYAVLHLLAGRLEAALGHAVGLDDVREGRYAEAAAAITVATATDGNHGRSIAWGARLAGCRCRIYVHAKVSEGRRSAMEAFGAEVVRIDGDYDASVHRCAEEAAANGWFVVSDTSYAGYSDLPRQVMAGCTLMASEVLEACGAAPPTHVFAQAGVGGLAAAVCAEMWMVLGERRPHFVIVESERAACLLESARAGTPRHVAIREETVMAGLSCGEVSLLAWEILSRGAADFVAISDEAVAPAMRLLASGAAGGGAIEAGECAVAGVVALIAASGDPEMRARLGLDVSSCVLLLGSEGAIDPEIYRAIVAA
ncbi:MAG: diaminopropionate ammonia-lyase [Kiloniellaceae bacterium]|nr:diaminopropionate ammonia-lyase [Kiloniellaceae bacterium]